MCVHVCVHVCGDVCMCAWVNVQVEEGARAVASRTAANVNHRAINGRRLTTSIHGGVAGEGVPVMWGVYR